MAPSTIVPCPAGTTDKEPQDQRHSMDPLLLRRSRQLDSEGWAVRHVDLQGPTLRPVTAAALGEVLDIRDRGDRTAMAVYQHKYGILAEGSLAGWQETDSAAEILATEFERIWASAPKGITGATD
ncbi:hypothetical protein ACFXKG_39850 [Streptomyces sp. NPDC059255]|uniref:hypothetical protein n=1 Tax=Streptomyces sp. NPDC059255 TaxID=3346793 RepID=UPI003676F6E5